MPKPAANPMPEPLNDPARQTLLWACSLALGSLVPVALFQTGVINRLPDLPGRLFRSAAITRSPQARVLGLPDSLPGLGSYAATLALILLARRSPRLRPVLAAKLAFDGAAAATNTVRQITSFRGLCSWCLITAGATAVMVYAGRNLVTAAATDTVSAAVGTLASRGEGPEPVLDALSPHG